MSFPNGGSVSVPSGTVSIPDPNNGNLVVTVPTGGRITIPPGRLLRGPKPLQPIIRN